MNWFERMVAEWLTKRIVNRGWKHKHNITDVFRVIRSAVEDEFPEDNFLTMNAFLQECFDDSKDVH